MSADGASWNGCEWPGMIPLRCQSCGDQIGVTTGPGQPDPGLVVARCTMCAAVEEAEAILGNGPSPQGSSEDQ